MSAQSARSERAELALEQGAEQMVYVGMNVLEEEAAARIWWPAGTGNGVEHQLIRQSACWLVALATLSTLPSSLVASDKLRTTLHQQHSPPSSD